MVRNISDLRDQFTLHRPLDAIVAPFSFNQIRDITSAYIDFAFSNFEGPYESEFFRDVLFECLTEALQINNVSGRWIDMVCDRIYSELDNFVMAVWVQGRDNAWEHWDMDAFSSSVMDQIDTTIRQINFEAFQNRI